MGATVVELVIVVVALVEEVVDKAEVVTFSLGEPVVVTGAAVVDAGERVGGGAYVLR